MGEDGKRVGMQSYITFNGTNIPITKYTFDVARTLVDSTDNTNYDGDANILFNTQIPVMANTTVNVEGMFHVDSIPSALMFNLYSGIRACPTVLGLDAGAVMGHGLFDISNFASNIDIKDVVKYTCTLVSNSKFFPYS